MVLTSYPYTYSGHSPHQYTPLYGVKNELPARRFQRMTRPARTDLEILVGGGLDTAPVAEVFRTLDCVA
jgi:hypothetical protein